jgi:hypothetical protein
MTVAGSLDGATADALRAAAAHAFDAGVGITAVIGAVLVAIAAVIAATTLKGSARPRRSLIVPTDVDTDGAAHARVRAVSRSSMSRVIKLAVIPGDGIGPEVVAEAEKVLDAVTAASEVTFDKTRFSLGAARYLDTGDTLTDDDLAAVAAHDAILLGAVGGVPGDPRLKDANIERGLLLKLRFSLDHYVNLRPSKLYPGAPGRSPIPGRSTSSSFARVRRAPTSATADRSAPVRRTRWPTRPRSTRRSASSASCATPSPRRSADAR